MSEVLRALLPDHLAPSLQGPPKNVPLNPCDALALLLRSRSGECTRFGLKAPDVRRQADKVMEDIVGSVRCRLGMDER